MAIIVEGQRPYTGGTGVDIDGNKVISVLLREEDNLILVNNDNELYTDLQLADGIEPDDDLPVGVTVGKVLEDDGRTQNGLLLNWKTTSGDYARWIYGADGKIYFDGGTGTWTHVYYSSEVDALFTALRNELATVAFTGDYNDLRNRPTIPVVYDGTLTIQKNGTKVGDFTANQQADESINITVPVNTSDLNNDSGFIDKNVNDLTYYTKTSDLATVATTGAYSDLSGTPNLATVATTGDYDDLIDKPNLATVATSGSYSDLINQPTIPSVIDNVTSSSTTDALSALQGKNLQDQIDKLKALGKFLSLWDASTGQPISFPESTPYTYSTGDYYLVETIASGSGTNYRPNGSSYTGTASTTAETDELEVGDLYIYDGTTWLLQINHGKTVSFANLAGQPSDNTNLASALNAKADSSSLATVATSGSYTDLSNTPTIPAAQIQSDWNQSDNTKLDYIKNKPTIPAGQVQSDWNQTTSTAVDYIKNKPTIPTVNNATLTIQKNSTNVATFTANASSNVTADISVPTKVSDLNNDSGFITKSVNDLTYYTPTTSLATVATTGSYSDLSNTPTIPTVNNTTITFTQGGTSKGDITLNQSSAETIALDAGVPSGGNNGDVLTNVSGTPTWAAPSGGVTKSSIQVTLTTAGWSANSQTVSATGVTATNDVIVSPAPANIATYADKGVYCSAQGSGTLTFGCDTEPSGDIVVNVLIMS